MDSNLTKSFSKLAKTSSLVFFPTGATVLKSRTHLVNVVIVADAELFYEVTVHQILFRKIKRCNTFRTKN